MDPARRVPVCGCAVSKHTAYPGMELLLSSTVFVLSTKPNALQAGRSRGRGPAPRLQYYFTDIVNWLLLAALDVIWAAYESPPLEAVDQVSNRTLRFWGRM